MFCKKCGEEINDEAVICPKCGCETGIKTEKTPAEIADFYWNICKNDMLDLNIEMPEHICPATTVIKEIINFVQDILDNGYGYITKNGVYFDTSKYPNYGKLGGMNQNDKKFGARIGCTHVHDNDCVQDNDLHLLPFDGRIDFGRVARQIRESRYTGPLTLEIHATNSDKYNFMTLQAFLERAALSIKRLRSMVDFETL